METKKVKRYFSLSDKNDSDKNSSSNPKKKNSKKKNYNDKNNSFASNQGVDKDNIMEFKPNLKRKHFKLINQSNKSVQKDKKSIKKNKYPGRMPISKEKLMKYSKGEGLEGKGVTHPFHLKKLRRKERDIADAALQAARTEILLPEDVGFLEADKGETTTQFTQKQIASSVDIASAAKHFELHLPQFGPYRIKYSRNGRHLLLGGKMGHVAAFDWVTKHLNCEINVMETVHDICWMHIETMFAVAQKDWVYMYDNKGTEVHCLKGLNKVTRMEFLPYHFLLATGSELGYLSWLDISIGQMAGQYRTNLGNVSIMKQNPYNAVLCVGQSKGIVSMWSPTVKSPLATLLCHKAPLSALAIDPRGKYMATAAIDRSVKIWDVRNLEGPLQTYYLRSTASQLDFSHNNLLAIGMENIVEVYRDCCTKQPKKPYLQHRMNAIVENLSFCPYEDVLGVGTNRGFVSLIIPGSGEANFDALECNPYQSKSQRREAEVKALLEKIQPELISLNPTIVAEVDVPTLKDKVDAHNKLLRLKPMKVNYKPRRKTKNKGTAKVARNKKIVQELATKEFVKNMKDVLPKEKESKKTKSFGVLDRFVKKVK